MTAEQAGCEFPPQSQMSGVWRARIWGFSQMHAGDCVTGVLEEWRVRASMFSFISEPQLIPMSHTSDAGELTWLKLFKCLDTFSTPGRWKRTRGGLCETLQHNTHLLLMTIDDFIVLCLWSTLIVFPPPVVSLDSHIYFPIFPRKLALILGWLHFQQGGVCRRLSNNTVWISQVLLKLHPQTWVSPSKVAKLLPWECFWLDRLLFNCCSVRSMIECAVLLFWHSRGWF